MKMNRLVGVFLFVGLISNLIFAQSKLQEPSVDVRKMLHSLAYPQQGFSLLGIDPSKLKMNHSYTLTFSSFGSGSNLGQGLYLNTISYQFSNYLSMNLQWGLLHQPLATGLMAPQTGAQLFLSNAELRYQPMKNMVMKLQFNQIPASLYYPYSYRSGPMTRFRSSDWWEDEE
ncbi:hypothetical protein L0128_16055 [candidate division KSB1 bacterium]|nr:hypothetical protein [candidate division KSB1 bacterium]